jgi:hypothetical protein
MKIAPHRNSEILYRVNLIHWFSAAARCSHCPHGLIPNADVARLITSPRPISFSFKNPGSRTLWGSLFAAVADFACALLVIEFSRTLWS